MKFSWRTEWPMWLILAAMFAAAALAWPTAPGRIPAHWDMHGQVTDYGGKFQGLLLVPFISVVIYLSLLLLPMADPLRANYERFAGTYTLLRVTILLFLAALEGLIHLWIRGYSVPIQVVLPLGMGVLFSVVGTVLGKVQPNWFVGIRTPWTLTSRRSWVRTHRAARWVFIAAGVGFATGGLLASEAVMIGTIVVMVAGILGVVAYSYIVWRGDPDR